MMRRACILSFLLTAAPARQGGSNGPIKPYRPNSVKIKPPDSFTSPPASARNRSNAELLG